MKKIKIAIIGSGGHAKSCIQVIERLKNIEIIGLVDNNLFVSPTFSNSLLTFDECFLAT